ncbi:MAG TPA: hypothetical protein VKB38_16000 [Terracidiphilus sp.]|nr:hypothetical protein [Terracidiphilus sp.]
MQSAFRVHQDLTRALEEILLEAAASPELDETARLQFQERAHQLIASFVEFEEEDATPQQSANTEQ